MRGFVANIDIEWFTCLRERHPLEGEPLADVRGDAFRALQPGEPLFFGSSAATTPSEAGLSGGGAGIRIAPTVNRDRP